MFIRILTFIFCIPAAILGALFLFVFVINILGAPITAQENNKIRLSLAKFGQYISDYHRLHGTFPSEDKIDGFYKNLDLIGTPRIETQRPVDRDFTFPTWDNSKANFAISYWRGEWTDYFDSATATTTLDSSSHTFFWVKDAFYPFGLSLLFGVPSLTALWIVMRRKTEQGAAANP